MVRKVFLVVSIVGAFASLVVWVSDDRIHGRPDEKHYRVSIPMQGWLELGAFRGCAYMHHSGRPTSIRPPGSAKTVFEIPGIHYEARISFAIFGAWVQDRWVMIHSLLLILAFAVYPSLAFIRGPLRRHRRRKHGLCLVCGYNLTGNTSGVCSECGTTVTTP